MTDEHGGYVGIGREFEGGHKSVNHSKGEYARPDGTTTNTVESHFALLKRGVIGTFHRVSPKHLQRYCDEFDFRSNHRKSDEVQRTKEALRHIEGKRLTYYEAMPEAG